MVLVVGATGLVGSEICERLLRRGERVRALVRATSSKEKIEALRLSGAELCIGDLKDPVSIVAACHGVNAVISTASSTLTRQSGDSIESVDAAGQLNLVNAARSANVGRFLFVSFRRPRGISFPLGDAKEQVENAITSLTFTVIRASWFMEVWLSPALGFDYVNAAARIYGPGTSPISWVSSRDVAEICAISLRHPAAERRTIEFGGPEALSPIEVVACFERISGRPFELEHVSELSLRSQFETATDSMQKSFAALMLAYLHGDSVNMASIVDTFGIKLTNVSDYAHAALGKARTS
jgi:uncharacterized protein YbjT (DUF2867 family)